MHSVFIGEVEFNNDKPLALIAGPCVMESQEHAVMMAKELQKITLDLGLGFVFKASFDKANRTSLQGFRGIGIEAAREVFNEINYGLKIPVITDIHEAWQAYYLVNAVSAFQIPALLSRQTDLIIAAAATGLPVNIKKGQWMHAEDMAYAKQKAGTDNLLLTERGTTFGYNTLVVDMRNLVLMKPYAPVLFDCTHSVQAPNSLGGSSGGKRGMGQALANAAVAIGIAGLFMECHEDPNNAPCDGPVMQYLHVVPELLKELIAIDKVVKQ